MDNHYHLLVRTLEVNRHRIMRHLNGLYTQYCNRTTGKDRPLFRGRYKAILLEAQAYWNQLSRYIHRNPVEAGVVRHLDRYRWSSYPAYIGLTTRPPWLTCAYTQKSLATRRMAEAYQAYVAKGIDEEFQEFYAQKKKPPILGSATFKEGLKLGRGNIDVPELRQARAKPTVARIVVVVGQRLGVGKASVWTSRSGQAAHNPERGMALYVCQRGGAMPLREIAHRFGVKPYASARSGIRQFETRLVQDRQLQQSLNLIQLDLNN